MSREKRIKRYFTKGHQTMCLACCKPLNKREFNITVYSVFQVHKECF